MQRSLSAGYFHPKGGDQRAGSVTLNDIQSAGGHAYAISPIVGEMGGNP